VQILVYVRLSSADTRSPQPYYMSLLREKYVVITRKDVVLTRNICRFNEKRCRYYEKRCRYYEKICRFNEKRSRYYEKRSRYNEKRSRYYEKRSRYYEKRSRYNDIIEWKKYYVDGSITSPYVTVQTNFNRPGASFFRQIRRVVLAWTSSLLVSVCVL